MQLLNWFWLKKTYYNFHQESREIDLLHRTKAVQCYRIGHMPHRQTNNSLGAQFRKYDT